MSDPTLFLFDLGGVLVEQLAATVDLGFGAAIVRTATEGGQP